MEILTRLNAKAGMSEGLGGVPELTTSDICAALAGANEAGLELLIGQVCGEGDINAICETFLPDAIRLSKRLKWRSDEQTMVRIVKLLDIVVYQSLSPNKCPTCRGTKHDLDNPVKSCETCKGTGGFTIPQSAKAEYLGMTGRAWRKTWSEREEDLKMLLERRLHQAKLSICNHLYDTD